MNNETDYHDQPATGAGFAAGLLWGAAFGAAVALLFAPKSGADLRGGMSDSANRFGRRARDGYDKARDTYERAGAAVSEVTGRVRDLASDVAGHAAEVRERFSSTTRVS